jgi:DNA helicase-2/ATP-dependent DNA helicase PcrA
LSEACDRIRGIAATGKSFSPGLGEMEQLFRRAGEMAGSLTACFDAVLAYYSKLGPKMYDDWFDRLGDLEMVQNILSVYSGLADFLTDMAIDPPERAERGVKAGYDDPESPVVLSTIHSSKGLEWENVFLVGAREGCLPLSRCASDPNALEEEHRLLYVAITRAQTKLFLTMRLFAAEPGLMNKLSRFLDAPNVRPLMTEHISPSVSIAQTQAGEAAAQRPSISKDDMLKQLLAFREQQDSGSVTPSSLVANDPQVQKALETFRVNVKPPEKPAS